MDAIGEAVSTMQAVFHTQKLEYLATDLEIGRARFYANEDWASSAL